MHASTMVTKNKFEGKKLQNIRRILYFCRDKNVEEYRIDRNLIPSPDAPDRESALQNMLNGLNNLELQKNSEKRLNFSGNQPNK